MTTHSTPANRWLRWMGWCLFWGLAMIAASVVGVFLWVAVPLVISLARGGRADMWFMGDGAAVLTVALAYLVAAVWVVMRRRGQQRGKART